MTVLFLTLSSFSSFPTYKRAIGMGEALAQLGHKVYVAVLNCEENRVRMAKEAPHCEPLWVEHTGVIRETIIKLRMIRRLKPDVLYSTSFSVRNLAFLGCLVPRQTKMVVEFCELYSEYPTKRLGWKFRETMAVFENGYLLCASKYLERHFKGEAQKWKLKRQVEYSPYAYPSYLKPKVNFTAHAPHIVFMASLWRGYGVYDVIEAVVKLLHKIPDIHLEILGGGPEKENLHRLVAERKLERNIHIRGFVSEDELNDYFSQASVFVAPLHDTLQDKARCPSKLFYYIPYGKPIVTCPIGDPIETLGEYGYYYKCDDIDDMSRAIQQAILASSSFAYPNGFVERHSWMARARQFEEFVK